MKFEIGQVVEGKVCGRFLVTGFRKAGSTDTVDVREIGPSDQLGRETGMTADCFKS